MVEHVLAKEHMMALWQHAFDVQTLQASLETEEH
jgi:hypothetical protein